MQEIATTINLTVEGNKEEQKYEMKKVIELVFTASIMRLKTDSNYKKNIQMALKLYENGSVFFEFRGVEMIYKGVCVCKTSATVTQTPTFDAMLDRCCLPHTVARFK